MRKKRSGSSRGAAGIRPTSEWAAVFRAQVDERPIEAGRMGVENTGRTEGDGAGAWEPEGTGERRDRRSAPILADEKNKRFAFAVIFLLFPLTP